MYMYIVARALMFAVIGNYLQFQFIKSSVNGPTYEFWYLSYDTYLLLKPSLAGL